jgi:hypothetical protein
VPSASGPVFIFCAPELVFGGTEGVESLFNVLRSRTRFWRCRARRVPFSCFALPDSFSVVSWASSPVFMFCATRLIFDGTEGVRSFFHVLRSRTHFRLYRGRRVPFSCFVLPDSFSAVPNASGPVFIFCPHGLIFGSKECVGSRLHILRSWTYFRRYRGRRVPLFMFCAPGLVFSDAECVGSRFIFCPPGLVIGGVECVGSHFHVLCSRSRFRRCRVCRVLFSCFARPDLF